MKHGESNLKTPITIWYRQKWEHNHIQNGHSELDKPAGINAEQRKNWENVVWKKKYGYLEDGKVIE